MTVSELIKRLEQLDQETPIRLSDGDLEYYPLKHIKPIVVGLYPGENEGALGHSSEESLSQMGLEIVTVYTFGY